MAFSYDSFVAELECPLCHTVSAGDDTIEMYTYLREQPHGEFLRVGSQARWNREAVSQGRADGYITLRAVRTGERLELLTTWRCCECGGFNWAQVSIGEDGVIAAIRPVLLTQESLAANHLLSNEAEFVASALLGVPAGSLSNDETLQTLREKLP